MSKPWLAKKGPNQFWTKRYKISLYGCYSAIELHNMYLAVTAPILLIFQTKIGVVYPVYKIVYFVCTREWSDMNLVLNQVNVQVL